MAEAIQIMERCHASPMEYVMEHSEHMPSFGKVVSSIQRCMKIQRSLLEDATDVRSIGISTHEMQCLSQTISKLNFLMFGALISWAIPRVWEL